MPNTNVSGPFRYNPFQDQTQDGSVEDTVDPVEKLNLADVSPWGNLAEFVEEGCSFTVDGANVELDITNGRAYIFNDGPNYVALPDEVTIPSSALTDGATNHVFLAIDVSGDQLYYHTDTDKSPPNDPSLYIGSADFDADTPDEENRFPVTPPVVGEVSGGGGVDAEDDGSVVVSGASALNFNTDLSVTDDGDGTVTIDASGGINITEDGETVVSGAGTVEVGPGLTARKTSASTAELVNSCCFGDFYAGAPSHVVEGDGSSYNAFNTTTEQFWLHGFTIDEILYSYANGPNEVYAWDINDQSLVWSNASVTQSSFGSTAIAKWNDKIIVTGDSVQIVNRFDGSIEATISVTTSGGLVHPPAVVNDICYTQGDNGSLIAVDLVNETELYSTSETTAESYGAPIYYNGSLWRTWDDDNEIREIDPSDGSVLSQFTVSVTPAPWSLNLDPQSPNYAYGSDDGGSVFAVDLDAGTERWVTTRTTWGDALPGIYDTDVYIWGDSSIWALDRSGNLLWENTTPTPDGTNQGVSPVVDPPYMYVKADDSYKAFFIDDGSEAKNFGAPDAGTSYWMVNPSAVWSMAEKPGKYYDPA